MKEIEAESGFDLSNNDATGEETRNKNVTFIATWTHFKKRAKIRSQP